MERPPSRERWRASQ